MTYMVRDLYIGPNLFLHGAWEGHLIRLLSSFDIRDKVAIDIGANIGLYTLPLSEAVGPAGKVIALEPDPGSAALLSRNLAQNGITNVEVMTLAAGREEAMAPFVNDPWNSGNHRIVDDSQPHDRTVKVVSVDSLTAGLPDSSIGFIKIDVQGYELDVVEGMLNTLQRNPEAVIQIEISAGKQAKAATVVSTLQSAGFDGVEVTPDRTYPLQDIEYYEAPFFRDQADLIVARDAVTLKERLRQNFATWEPPRWDAPV
jgi:FkbM family methyltransferase